MWKTRSKKTATPFPAAIGRNGRQELFNAVEITDWLSVTGRGNNPHAAQDAAAFSSPLGPETKHTHFAGLTALLALRCLTDMPLGGQNTEDLLDSADEYDPDDEFLFAEIENLDSALLPLAAYADLLTDASYTAAAAFEQLLGDRFRTGPAVQAKTMLTAEATELLAATAVELAAGSEREPVFTDDGGSDFLLAVAEILGEAAPATLCVGDRWPQNPPGSLADECWFMAEPRKICTSLTVRTRLIRGRLRCAWRSSPRPHSPPTMP
ncbi:hypothetical protein [Arthrobacter psychrolactophilus]